MGPRTRKNLDISDGSSGFDTAGTNATAHEVQHAAPQHDPGVPKPPEVQGDEGADPVAAIPE